MNGIIYMYTSPSGKKYVGQTWDEYGRKRAHKARTNPKTIFSKAIKHHGWESFVYTVLHSGVQSQEEMDKLEIEEMEKNNSMYPNGYNQKYGGSHGRHSEETSKIISDNVKNLWKSEEYRKMMAESHSSIYTEEYRQKMSEITKSRCDKEHIGVFKERMKRFWNKPENKELHSQNEKRKWSNPEFKAKMSESRQRTHTTEYFRIKSSLLQKRFVVRCIETGVIYRSARMAAEKNKTHPSGVMRCCNGERKTAGGFHWEFA